MGRVLGHQGDPGQVSRSLNPYPDGGGNQAPVGWNIQCHKTGSTGLWEPEVVTEGFTGRRRKVFKGWKQRDRLSYRVGQ